MRPSTEEFLYMLLWGAETMLRPSWRNLNDGFDAWAWRSGLSRRIAELERMQLLELAPGKQAVPFVRLTEKGRLAAIGGRDPVQRWNRDWDGRWRMVVFDIPREHHRVRVRLLRYFRLNGFGFLQNSLWITPDTLEPHRNILADKTVNVEASILLDGVPCGGESNPHIVRGAWDFEKINRQYEFHGHILDARPRGSGAREAGWLQAERVAWKQAIGGDPLLPQALLPDGYLGKLAWQRRIEMLAG